MKILLLNPPFLPKFSRTSRSPGISKGGCLYYPIWLAYAAVLLEKKGHKIKLIDAPARGYSVLGVVSIAKKFNPELTVLDTSTPSIYNDVKVAEAIKDALPNTFICLVGTHASALPEETIKLSKKIDTIARQEYDLILCNLAQALEQKKALKSVNGITFIKNNRMVSTPDQKFIENLDQFPFVSKIYKEDLNVGDYFYPANLYPEITIISGRGCPFRCSYCVIPQVMNGHRYRTRSIENVADEFGYIKKNFPEAKEIFIEDDTLTANRKRVREFCGLLIKRKIKIAWSANARADVDLETLKIMKKAGCRLLCVGFESASQEILENIHKGIKIETIRQFMKDTKKAGILVHGCFLLGNKGETKETARKTIEFAKELDPDTAQFFPIMVYPGTEAYGWAKGNNYLITANYAEWLTDGGVHNSIVSTPSLTNKELVELCDIGRKEFYLRPGYIARKLGQVITNPREIKRTAKSARTFFKYLKEGSFNKKQHKKNEKAT